ncbi:hypothetical protein DKX38_023507 [Salix brachista]|uniref:Uncharacterized protein n=1 Tax=Salix brachista TaxID=2182728 RepID=A0A5N5JJ31_9ROSI|nr:hypothetical protein DKX38_023507 [Salix brachista]
MSKKYFSARLQKLIGSGISSSTSTTTSWLSNQGWRNPPAKSCSRGDQIKGRWLLERMSWCPVLLLCLGRLLLRIDGVS